MHAYRDAIFQVVRQGDVVADIGAGLGVLSLQACAAGAARVYAIEIDAVANLIPDIANTNGFADRIVAYKGVSFEIDLPERVDIVIASMLDSFGVDSNLLEVVIDARRRLLKPGGTIIPSALQLSVCPIEVTSFYEENVARWSQPRFGFSFGDARRFAANQRLCTRIQRESLLATPKSSDQIELLFVESAAVSFDVDFLIERIGVFHGFAGWFDATMAAGVRCGNSPLDAHALPWALSIFPVEHPVPVQPGYTVKARIRAVTFQREITWVWNAQIFDLAGVPIAVFKHSTFEGSLITRHELVREIPQ